MSYRKLPYLLKSISQCGNILPIPSFQNITRQKVLPFVCTRLYSKDFIADDNAKNDPKPQNVNLLSQLFPQTTLYTPDSQSAKDQQNEFEKETKEKTEEHKKSWRRTKIGFGIFGASLSLMGATVVYEMGKPQRDGKGEIIEDKFSHLPPVQQYVKRTWNEMSFYQKMIKEPSRDKLLPDPVPEPYQPNYTLVLEFTDVLVHPDWTYQTGWRFKKRPGLDSFLTAMASSSYEVVIFTNENPFVIWPVIEQLDPNHEKITYKLFRDSTHFTDGVHIKNLDYLNRDLSKVIVIDWNTQSTKYHPQNTLRIPKWKGNDDDTTLLDLTALLKTIATSEISDVREVLGYYNQFDDPIAAFRDNQRRLIEQMDEQEKRSKSQQPPITSKWTKTFLSK